MLIQNLWFRIKKTLKLPFPIHNHYYKGRIITAIQYWLCGDCQKLFEINRKESQEKLLSEICCPNCSSKKIYAGTDLFKGIVDGLDSKDLLAKQIELQNRTKEDWIRVFKK
jgi:DNA-directed RNA polymerase subunit RPC12/RpoP